MSYKCEILADSLSPQGHRLTTFKVTYPRIIHAEMCRHRILSRNTASSRAIPFEKMVKDVQENPFIPIAWQKDHKGMQGVEYLDENIQQAAEREWLKGRDASLEVAENLNRGGCVTKQLCNRLLEPFVWTTELVSGTEWENFFELRCPRYMANGNYYRSKKDAIKENEGYEVVSDLEWLQSNDSQAEIHIQKIAEMMWDCYNESKPKTLQSGQWHIPYGDNFNNEELFGVVHGKDVPNLYKIKDFTNDYIKIATARAARISYTTLGDNPKIDYEADIKLHDRLLESKHLSCFEHCAKVMSNDDYARHYKGTIEYDTVGAVCSHNEVIGTSDEDGHGWCNNYRGFIQYRYLIENQ